MKRKNSKQNNTWVRSTVTMVPVKKSQHKRSRSIAKNDGEDAPQPSPKLQRNPFLMAYHSPPSSDASSPVDPTTPSILETWIDAVSDFEEAPLTHAGTLIQCLRTTRVNDEGGDASFAAEAARLYSLVSRNELVSMLLAWAVPCAIKQPPEAIDKIVWEALDACLERNEGIGEHQSGNIGHQFFSQSNLFKFLPKLAIHCVSFRDDASFLLLLYKKLLIRFRPTLEVALKNVWIPVASAGSLQPQSSDETNGTGVSPSCNNANATIIRTTTLTWIQSILDSNAGNPRTTFQLFCTTNVLVAFAQVASDKHDSHLEPIQCILWRALFDPDHHIEGWISLLTRYQTERATVTTTGDDSSTPPKAAFRTYHEGLLETLREGLPQTHQLVALVPLLLHGYMEHSKQYLRNKRVRSTKGSSLSGSNDHKHVEAVSQSQFALFRQFCRPLLSTLQNESVSMKAVERMLSLVLQFDCYTPSSESVQSGNQSSVGTNELSFLEQIATACLDAPLTVLRSLALFAIPALETLLKLNYRILERRLGKAIRFCLRYRDETTFPLAARFLITVAHTHRQLRQQNQLLTEFLELSLGLLKEHSVDQLKVLSDLLDDSTVSTAIGAAVQFSPSQQVNLLFRNLNAYCEKGSKLTNELSKSSHASNILTRLCDLVLCNLVVNNGNAKDIAHYCQLFLNVAVAGVLSVVFEQPLLKTCALRLSGFALVLHERCVFWLGDSDALKLPPGLPDNSILPESSSEMFPNVADESLDATTAFCCRRLKQLHLQIQLQELRELDDPYVEVPSLEAVKEARRLVSLITKPLQDDKDTGLALHRVLVQYCCLWIPYASIEIVRAFLKQVLSTLALNDSRQERSMEAGISNCLLHDASFYEHEAVSLQIGVVTLSMVAEQAVSLCSIKAKKSDLQDLAEFASSSSFVRSDARASDKSFLHQTTWCNAEPLMIVGGPHSAARTTLCLRLMRLANSLPIFRPARPKDELLNVIGIVRTLDQTFRSLCQKSRRSSIDISLAGSLRMYWSNLLESVNDEEFQSFLNGKDDCDEVVLQLIVSTVALYAGIDVVPGPLEKDDFIHATGTLLEGIVIRTASLGNPRCWKNTIACFSEQNDMAASAVKTALARHLVQGLKRADAKTHAMPLAGKEAAKELTELYDQLTALALSTVSTNGTVELEPEMIEESSPHANCLLLLGDLLSCVGAPTDSKCSREWINHLEPLCLSALRRTTQSSDHLNLVYLTGCLAQARPSFALGQAVLDTSLRLVLSATTSSSNVLDATFDRILTTLECDKVEKLVALLVQSSSSHMPEPLSALQSRLRLLKLSLGTIRERCSPEHLTSVGRPMFRLALEALHKPKDLNHHENDNRDPSWADTVVAACGFLEALVPSREVFFFHEADLAVVLSHLSIVATPVSSHDKVYFAITSLLASLFYRYGKSLHGCVPSVVLLLHTLFEPIWNTDTTSTNAFQLYETSFHERCLRLTRLCEHLVHDRDVYKKHVIGLVLKFAQALERMEVWQKQALLPAVNLLLDTMSVWETNQLNAHMDVPTRSAFRNIHQSYQKLRYKGC